MSEERRIFLFVVLTILVVTLTWPVFRFILGPIQAPVPAGAKKAAEKKQDVDAADPEMTPEKDPANAKIGEPAVAEKPAAKDDVPPNLLETEPAPERVARVLGSTAADSGFNMKVELTSRGAAVQRIELANYRNEKRDGQLELVAVDGDDGGSFLLDIQGRGTPLAKRDWKVVESDEGAEQSADTESVRFETTLADRGLVITKTFRLKKGSYNFDFDVAIRNAGEKNQDVAYYLGGPRGTVLEGAWYSSKLRDVAIGEGIGATLNRHTVRAATLAKGAEKIFDLAKTQRGIVKKDWKLPPEWFDRFDADANERLAGDEIAAAAHGLAGGERNRWEKSPVRFAGVDGQFFCVLLVMPPVTGDADRWNAATVPVLVDRNRAHTDRSDVSVELQSKLFSLEPGADLHHPFTVYAGPRKRDVLEETLGDPAIAQSIINFQGALFIFPDWLVGFMANTMLALLQFFHGLVPNWGIAIIMLTVLVRLCMFPLSRKQTIRAMEMQQKMAKIKPELDKIKEKYKNNMQEMLRAQSEVQKKHGIDPRSQLAGCLPLLIQMPIFIGLWQGLSSSIDLRQQSFFLWIDDLAAPDALFGWGENIPLVSRFLGPYFNLLPAILVALFYFQQKMLMPPQVGSVDPQVEMQQKMMKWMLLMFGFFFWRLPSGLCVYYIASTLWGLAERKLLPKVQHVSATPAAEETERTERDSGSRKGQRKDGRGTRPAASNGKSLRDRFEELLKKASKK